MDVLTSTCILSVVVLGIWIFSKWIFSYWKRVGLEYPEPEILFGNTRDLLTGKISFGDQFKKIYNALKSKGLKHGGFYMSYRPMYMPIDLDLIKCILQKDFNHFVNHGVYSNEKVDPLTGHLFNLEDKRWRNLRAKLTPTFTSDMVFFTIVFILSAIIISIWLFSKWNFSYWRRIGLEYPEPEFLFGNTKDFLTRKLAFGDQFKIIYDELKSRGVKHGGCYMSFRPVYVPIDIDLVKSIMQKDFNHFINHGMYFNEKADPLSGHLFNLEDEKWKNLRAKLTPTFTSGKMKMMFQTLGACTSGLEDILKDYSIIQDAVDIKDVVSRFTTDVIGSVAFGLDCNSLKNPDSEFRQWGRKIFKQSFTRRIKNSISMLIPRHILIKLGIKLMSSDIEDFFMNVVKSTVEYRESNDVYRKDFMHLLLQLKNRGEIADDENITKQEEAKGKGQLLTFNEIAAQCFVFFIAGFETSATTMTFALLELAINQDVQNKLREEIESVLKKHDGQITYEAIMSMSYLDKVIQETLRKHSPVPGIPRVCNKAYRVPDTDVILEVGTRVHIPFQAIHWDHDHYPEPEKFDPERFNEENKAKRHPFAFLPFGEGPRICIGARFGLLQVKVGLTTIIGNFKVTLNEKTKTPIKYASNAFITSVEGDVWLNVEKLN